MYITRILNIRELLERSDCRIFRESMRTNSPIVKILPERNFTNYALQKPGFYHPIVATERFKSSYVNRLTFRYDIDSLIEVNRYVIVPELDLDFFLFDLSLLG